MAVSAQPIASAALAAAFAIASTGCRNDKAAPPEATLPTKAPPATGTASAPEAPPPKGTFVDVTEASGIRFTHHPMPGLRFADPTGYEMNHYGHASGLACADVDGDGKVDLYLMDQAGPNALFKNLGGLRFRDITPGSGTALSARVSTAPAFADLDADGDQDLLVGGAREGIAVLRNDGTGRFDDVSAASGLAERIGHITVVGLIDGDGDGLVDVLAGHSAIYTEDRRGPDGRWLGAAGSMGHNSQAEASHYYRNLGGLRFAPADEASGILFEAWPANPPPGAVPSMFWAGDAIVTDFEPDGLPDLVVTNGAGKDKFFKNLGGGRFKDVIATLLDRGVYGSFGAAVLDADLDGRLDIAIADMHSDMFLQPHSDLSAVDWKVKHRQIPMAKTASVAKQLALWRRTVKSLEGGGDEERLAQARVQVTKVQKMLSLGQRMIFGNALLKNTGERRWPDASSVAGIENIMPWGVVASDFDLDGDEDLYFPAGMGWPWDWTPDFFYRNRGDGVFDEIAEEVGLVPPPGERHVGEVLETVGRSRNGMFVGKARSRRAVASRASVACDFDDDGDQDLAILRWDGPARLFENRMPAPGSRPLVLRLRGKPPHVDAIGARVVVQLDKGTLTRMVPGTGGYLAGPERRLFFGLPEGRSIRAITVHWPYAEAQELDGAAFAPRAAAYEIKQP